MEDNIVDQEVIVQLSRLGLEQNYDDLRLFIKRLAKRYRLTQPQLSKELSRLIKHNQAKEQPADIIRDIPNSSGLLKQDLSSQQEPHLTSAVKSALDEMILERQNIKLLQSSGLEPVSSAIFTGAPGVGKTMAAKWIASILKLPLYKLDLASSISSRLGETGTNLQSVFEQTSASPSILFLDEIDSIAKSRSDGHEIGEMKRLVTVLLQQLDSWNPQSIVLAATNNSELIDTAIWRRFELKVDFPMPSEVDLSEVLTADIQYWGEHVNGSIVNLLCHSLSGQSYSDARSLLSALRKKSVLAHNSLQTVILNHLGGHANGLTHPQRMKLAQELVSEGELSQRKISTITGISRETLRKFGGSNKKED